MIMTVVMICLSGIDEDMFIPGNARALSEECLTKGPGGANGSVQKLLHICFVLNQVAEIMICQMPCLRRDLAR